jgi:hypothetical protein
VDQGVSHELPFFVWWEKSVVPAWESFFPYSESENSIHKSQKIVASGKMAHMSILRIGVLRGLIQKTGDKAFMVDLLRDASKRQCAFNVDRIYGILGLVSEDIRRCIKVDYSLEERFWEVWILAGKVISVLGKDLFSFLLEITDCCDHDNRCPELASWFPDLRRRNVRKGVAANQAHPLVRR